LLLVVGAIAVVYGWRLKQAPASTEKEIKSLAVMPLESVNPDENHLGLGIADAVILRISQTGKLVVRPTSAGRRYLSEDTDGLTAAKQLGVDSVLEGTVQRANNRLRVNVNLLRTSDGISLWSDSFNLNAGDIFAIQDTISQQVASRLQLKLDAEQQARLGKRYTNNQEAYEYYVKGRTNLERLTIAIGDREAIDAAIINFKKAVELDSKYALAYAQLGYAYMWMANFTDPDNNVWVGLAQTALSEAETLDPLLAEIHEARFEYYFSKLEIGTWFRQRAKGVRLWPLIQARAIILSASSTIISDWMKRQA
jgi:TolB-like protein